MDNKSWPKNCPLLFLLHILLLHFFLIMFFLQKGFKHLNMNRVENFEK